MGASNITDRTWARTCPTKQGHPWQREKMFPVLNPQKTMEESWSELQTSTRWGAGTPSSFCSYFSTQDQKE